jgi:hypothetical protein
MTSVRARPRAARLGAGLTALALLAGCGHGAKAPAAAGPTTTVAPSTTTRPRPATFPLTGLPAGDSAAASRAALSIKVENTPPARPQAGLDAADLVTEELVEGGITRFLATFQSRDAATVGPVRSARPVDAALLRQLGGGLFGYAGAAAGEIAPVKASSTTVLVGVEQAPDAYYRVAGRPAPHNLYTSTGRLYRAAARVGARRGPPPALFRFAAQPPEGRRVELVAVPFSPVPDYTAGWRWDPRAGLWDRLQGGRPATVAGGAPITATNVVVLRVRVGTIPGLVDSLGNPDPNIIVVGRGACWVLRDGRVVQGTWERPSIGRVMRLIGPGGQVVPLHPGRTWVELEPIGFSPRLS